MILLWGLPGDDPFDAVAAELARRGTAVALLDQRRANEQRVDGDRVWCGDVAFDLGELRAAYTRVYVADGIRAESVEQVLWAWLDEPGARIVNPPGAMASNSSKPFQAARIAACGFRVPPTLVTTDAAAARAFWAEHREVIYKSISGVRSVVSRMGPQHEDRLADIAWCPTQFQAWIPGRDHRVHVVGADAFAVEIVSDADDYRYAARQGTTATLRATALPHDVADRCVATAHALGLPVAGIDLRRTHDGEWFCFEVNPSPCFTYYEHHAGQPLTAAVASLLAGGAP